MAELYAEQLRPAGDHLLGILIAEGPCRFSRFYNDDTDYAALAAAAGIPETYTDQAHVVIEVAAIQLKRYGIVTFEALADTLIDGENDYRISLTDKGQALLATGDAFPSRDMRL